MSENYLVINGNKTELTQEQLEQLGIEVKKENPFNVENTEIAYYVSHLQECESGVFVENTMKRCLPCKDKQLVEERVKQERLSRLLWKFAIENDGYLSEEEKRDAAKEKFVIRFNQFDKKYPICQYTQLMLCDGIMFKSREVAQRAIDEVILPFERGEIE